MKALPGQTRYVPCEPSDEDGEENALVSTKHALRFLYEDALRHDHYAMAVILKNTLFFCEKIINDRICEAGSFKKITGKGPL